VKNQKMLSELDQETFWAMLRVAIRREVREAVADEMSRLVETFNLLSTRVPSEEELAVSLAKLEDMSRALNAISGSGGLSDRLADEGLVTSFISDVCEIGGKFRSRSGGLFWFFERWCKEQQTSMKQADFSAILRRLGYRKRRYSGGWWWLGLQVRADWVIRSGLGDVGGHTDE